MAAKERTHEASRSAGVALADGEGDGRVAELEAALDRKERQLEAVIDQYEQVLATRERLRAEAGPDETFVWTDHRRADEE